MRRLSIIDLTGGRQPISGEDGHVSVVFNGEIYNYRELQRELETAGHRFRTHSDTEAIVHAYEQYGPSCLDRLRGMFALAIWDARTRTLFLARDRVGKKPLYYTLTPAGTFIFASELKALLRYPEIKPEVNLAALDAYLTFGYVPDPLSILRDVHKLAPGHALTFVNGRISVERYWDFPTTSTSGGLSEPEAIDALRVALDDAVRQRLVADVPLGAFLSGGVDSSAVVGLMARHLDRPVKTFSIGFAEDSHDELRYARLAAKHFGTEHHEFIVTPEICHVVDELAWFLDEPFADASAIPTFVVSKLARAHVTVALSGDGGDELFGGYTRYFVDQHRAWAERLPQAVRRRILAPVSRSLPHGAWGRNYLHNVSLDPLDRYLDSVSVFTALNRRLLYADSLAEYLPRGPSAEAYRAHASRVPASDPVGRLLYLDSKTYLPGDILTKVDRMSMAASLEVRAPLLDHKLIELVARIPTAMKLRDGATKIAFKRAVADLVPTEILNRPKQGFALPLQAWINIELREYVQDILTDRRTRERGYFSTGYVDLLLDEHHRQRRDHSTPLWALFMLELWHRAYLEGERGRRIRHGLAESA